jgi:hypothetical protein
MTNCLVVGFQSTRSASAAFSRLSTVFWQLPSKCFLRMPTRVGRGPLVQVHLNQKVESEVGVDAVLDHVLTEVEAGAAVELALDAWEQLVLVEELFHLDLEFKHVLFFLWFGRRLCDEIGKAGR